MTSPGLLSSRSQALQRHEVCYVYEQLHVLQLSSLQFFQFRLKCLSYLIRCRLMCASNINLLNPFVLAGDIETVYASIFL